MKGIFVLIMVSVALSAMSQEQLRGLTVTSRAPLRETALGRTLIDSAALAESPALSLADVLAYNTSVFVKSYGRATLSTVSFRGTSPSHTRVSWNGLDISSPMLGSTDFSTIPSYLVDRASMLHGSSSLTESAGGLGGAVRLSTAPRRESGWHAQYVQGIGSFSTFDEYLRIAWGNDRWQTSTRLVYSSSPNDFKYRNHDKKENIYDDDHNIVGSYYPEERNRSGAFKDFHALQQVYYDTRGHGRLGLNLWYTSSDRELPLLTTDYSDDTAFENRQRNQTLRSTLGWERTGLHTKWSATAGYIHTWTAYDYRRDPGNGALATLTRSRSSINTLMAKGSFDWFPTDRLMVTAGVTAYHNAVESHDGDITSADGSVTRIGYDRKRADISMMTSLRWRPVQRVGMQAVLRGDIDGDRHTPLIPALMADAVIWPEVNLTVKGSLSRNYRVPSLNDLYYMPGGNPDLRDERGWTYDLGLSAEWTRDGIVRLAASAGWFDSRIDDWILWLPTVKGFFSPRNIRRVHAYGVETEATAAVSLGRGFTVDGTANWSWTPSINEGEPVSAADQSVGKQLPYVPRRSASATVRVNYRRWSLLYKWCYYSERFTMSSNSPSLTGRLPKYYMSNVSVERTFDVGRAKLSCKFAVNNLFDEEYLSVLARPMPGINFELFLGVSI
ncbi:MAG: TonB-dependent receptor [Bacteroidales bacterium]|nr:TonB-dependent receptor [Bacteroidales bacterium]